MSTTTVTDAGRAARTFLAQDEARIDGEIKVRGEAIYTADCAREGMLWAAFAESPYPHATIVAIDAGAALAVPGVRAVITGQDVGERRFGNLLNDWPVLAYGEVTFIGEFVAAVAAETREAAAEAVALIDVTYEELPAQLDAQAAIAPDAPLTHAKRGGRSSTRGRRAHRCRTPTCKATRSTARAIRMRPSPRPIASSSARSRRRAIMPGISNPARRWSGSTAPACSTSFRVTRARSSCARSWRRCSKSSKTR